MIDDVEAIALTTILLDSLGTAIDALQMSDLSPQGKADIVAALRRVRVEGLGWRKSVLEVQAQSIGTEMPSWIKPGACNQCAGPIFFARTANNKWLPLCTTPLKLKDNQFYKDAVSVAFTGGKALVTQGLGQWWLAHGAICGKDRPDDEVAGPIWDIYYGAYVGQEESLVKRLLERMDEFNENT